MAMLVTCIYNIGFGRRSFCLANTLDPFARGLHPQISFICVNKCHQYNHPDNKSQYIKTIILTNAKERSLKQVLTG